MSLLLTLLLAGPAGAQSLPGFPGSKPAATPTPTPEPTPEPVPEAPDSPRASARSFVELAARKGDFEKAARYLSLPAGEEARGPELARRLRAVLERHLDIDLDAVSPLSEGAQQDGLPPGVDTVGSVPDGRGGRTRSSSSARATRRGTTGPSPARPCPASRAGTTRCPTDGFATGCRSASSATGRPV